MEYDKLPIMQDFWYGFKTQVPHTENWKGDKLLQPFGPTVFITSITEEFNRSLLDEASKLTKKDNDFNFSLAGNLKKGRSYKYSDEYIKSCEPYLKSKVEDYLSLFIESWGNKGVKQTLEESSEKGHIQKKIYLDSLWINFQKQHDFNPTHNHSGVFSFVIYNKVPKEIFDTQADSNHQKAGCVLFEYGESIIPMMSTCFTVTPYEGLMIIFPAKLKHSVPPFWIDKERISVSGNFTLVDFEEKKT